MSTKKKGNITTSKEWAKHLRPYGKRTYWKKERAAERCLCGAAKPGDWTAGNHHGEHRCARVITRLK